MGAYPVKFGKYMLLERVNVGGMAEVFKAKTFGVAGFERILAIKRILPSLVEDDEFIRMFIDEARIAVQLNHANIVQIYELGKHGDHYYIAMEYLPSRDLRSILDRLRSAGQLMPISQAAFITSKVCEGLDYAHRRRDPSGEPMTIIHRDVSPQNILITYEGDIKVIDFGIAKAANRASKTQAGVLKGKFGYMSPEQVRGLPIDRRSDIFAVGVLLYEMLTGERLFIGESDFSTLERVRNAEVIPPTTFNKKITPDLEQIVMKALAREAEDRYQWASDLAEDLQTFLIEDRSIYNPKRLAVQMKETYANEIAAERHKMEEFLSIDMDSAMPEVSESSRESLPSPYVEVKARASVETHTDPLPEVDDGIDFNVDDAEQFEEDKTFVIEASEAGKVLQKTGSESGPAVANDPSTRAPRVPEHTSDDFLAGASLYGEEASDLEDEAATMVSASNPFDENRPSSDGAEPAGGRTAAQLPEVDPHSETHAGFDGYLGTDPQAQALAAHSVTHHDGAASVPSGRFSPLGSLTGEDSAQTKAVASGVSGPMHVDPDEPTRAAPSGSSGFDLAGRQLPSQRAGHPAAAQPAPDDPPAGLPAREHRSPHDPPPTSHHGDATDRAPRAPMPLGGNLSRGGMIALLAGVAVMFLVFVAVAVGVVVKLTADDTIPIVLAPPDPASPPSMVKVFVDGDLVAQSLPAQVLLAAGQVLRVEADGYEPLELPLPAVDASLSPLTLPLQKTGGQGADDAKSADDEGAKTAPDPKPADAKPDPTPTPVEVKPLVAAADPAAAEVPADTNAPAEAPATDDKVGEGATDDTAPEPAAADTVLAAVATGPAWRVSFTAMADGASVPGARVLRDGQLVGTTPFEIQLASNVERVSLEVRADGFAAKQLDIARAGRPHVGPATVRLSRAPAGNVGTGTGDEAPPKPGDSNDDAKQPASEPAADAKAPATEAPADNGKPTAAPVAAQAAPVPSPAASEKTPDRASAPVQAPRQQRRARDKRVELSLGTRPFAQVIVDGKKLAQTTPLMGARALKLRPGDHVIQFIDTKTNKRYRYKVSLPADSPKNKLIIILGGDIRVKEGKAKAVELK